MRRGILVVVALSAILAAVPALANHTTQPDGRDTRGLLDVAEIRFDHFPGPLEWTFVTFRGWTLDRLWDHGYLLVRLDTRGDDDPDYLAMVRSDGRDLVAELFRIRRDGRQVALGLLESRKDSQRVTSVQVPMDAIEIGKGRTSYWWSATTAFVSSVCPKTCLDRVPDEGRVEQVLPTPSPSPSPTPSPSPSPTPSPTGGPPGPP